MASSTLADFTQKAAALSDTERMWITAQTWPVLLTGFTLSASLIVAIGAQNTLVLQQGIKREHVGAVVTTCAALDVVLMTLGVSGLAASLGQHPAALQALALGGALLLAWYAVSAFRRMAQSEVLRADASTATRPVAAVLAQTLTLSLLNPHVYLDTVVLVGAVGARQTPGTQAAFLVGAGGASVLWFALLGYGAQALAPLFAKPLAWRVLDGVVGLTMSVLAVSLARQALQ